MSKIAIVFHSGYGHTKKMAESVAAGAAGELVAIDAEGNLSDAQWATLLAADAIVFGSPTYMGSVSWQFKKFADASSKPWFTQLWKDKLAAGFTNSASMNGDKLSTLHYMFTLSAAAQHDLGRHGDDAEQLQGCNAQRHQLRGFIRRSDGVYAVGRQRRRDAAGRPRHRQGLRPAPGRGHREARALKGSVMATLQLLAISGSARNGSLNGRLLAAAAQAAASRGAQVETIDLRSLALPLYDGDLEKGAGVPEGAKRLRDALQAADGVLLATPEYNGFPTPLLVNSFDWLSRLQADGAAPAGLAVTAGKPLGLVSASPGLLGGLRSLNFTRQYLSMAIAMMPVPQQFALAKANEAFDEAGALKDPKHQAALEAVVGALVRVAAALKSPS
jgi:chromate reductase